jgi:hypothetical protein
MNTAAGNNFVILGYVAGLGLLWVYAVMLWWESRRVARRVRTGKEPGELL